jgi:hypothetical protein
MKIRMSKTIMNLSRYSKILIFDVISADFEASSEDAAEFFKISG